MIELLTYPACKIKTLEFVQSVDCVGTKIDFSSPDDLKTNSPLILKLGDQEIFAGEIEAKRSLFSPDKHEKQYGGRDLITISLDTCVTPKEIPVRTSIENFIKLIAPQLPLDIRGRFPLLNKFYLEPGETLIEQIQRAARAVGARAFVSRKKLVVAMKPIPSGLVFDERSKITSVEVEENISKVFDEVDYVDQKEMNKIRKNKRRTLTIHSGERDDWQRLAKQKLCDAHKNSFKAKISLAYFVDIEPLSLVRMNLPRFGLSGEFVVSAFRFIRTPDETKTEITLNLPESFDL